MTEIEWLTSEDPAAMLRWLNTGGLNPGDHKRRMWVLACRDKTGHKTANWKELAETEDLNRAVGLWASSDNGWEPEVPPSYRAALLREIVGNPWRPVKLPKARVSIACGPFEVDGYTIDRGWGPEYCPWFTSEVVNLAQHAYDSRDFSGLPILADALEEAGCASPRVEARFYVVRQDVGRDSEWLVHHSTPDRPASDSLFTSSMPQTATDWVERHCNVQLWHSPQEMKHAVLCEGVGVLPEHPHPLLAHLRSPGPHVRGCWALDLVLGLE